MYKTDNFRKLRKNFCISYEKLQKYKVFYEKLERENFRRKI